MADLKKSFEQAVADSKSLPERPDNATLLKIYALYKQASAGDVEGKRPGFSRLVVVGAEDPQVNAATIIKIEKPDEEEPFIPSAATMGAAFLHGAACTIHKAQGSQWPRVQVFAPDLWAAARAGQVEAGIALWKRLAYVAVTRAERELVWVTRYMISRPEGPLGGPGTLLPPA